MAGIETRKIFELIDDFLDQNYLLSFWKYGLDPRFRAQKTDPGSGFETLVESDKVPLVPGRGSRYR